MRKPATQDERGLQMMEYETPVIVDYGSIAEHTFTTPHGQYKGCKVDCHQDNFVEPSANTIAGSP